MDTAAVEERGARRSADALVIFGATGDLARKKLHHALYRLTKWGRLESPSSGSPERPWATTSFASWLERQSRAAWMALQAATSIASQGGSDT